MVFALSLVLAVLLTMNYSGKRSTNNLFWSLGMWLFSSSVGLEIAFSAGVFSEFLIRAYTFLVAVLVASLAIGSISLLKNKIILYSYSLYSAVTAIFLLFSLLVTNIGDILVKGIVYGTLPVLVVISSSLVTFPAAAILIIISLVSYRKTKNAKLLSIVAGVIVVSIAGTLYIASFPSFLYFAEFVGILLLWLGFVDLRSLFSTKEVKKEDVHGDV